MEQEIFTKLAVMVMALILFAMLLQFTGGFKTNILDRDAKMQKQIDEKLNTELKDGLANGCFVFLSLEGALNG